MNASPVFDVTILGSGFGGSLLGMILCRQGLRVCLVDQQIHPRFAIGESSTPAADMLLHSLAVKYGLDELLPLCRFGTWRKTYPELRCGCKRGFSYFWHGEQGYRPSEIHEHELLVAASSNREVADTQWYRADFDRFLCELAVKGGVTLLEETSVAWIEHRADQDWRLHLQQGQQDLSVGCRFLIDGTGPAAILLTQLQIPKITEQLKTYSAAVFSHFDQLPAINDWLSDLGSNQSDFPFPADDSAVHHLFPDGWMWQLRFEGGPASVGFATHLPPAGVNTNPSPEAHWEKVLVDHPSLRKLLGKCKLSPIPGKVLRTGRMQRLFGKGAGKDWAALPFTIGFIDPLHSTGIAHTLMGVQRLAQALTESEAKHRRNLLTDYSRRVVHELLHIDRLIAGCYHSLSHFENFTAWSMLYFSAATTFERHYKQNDPIRNNDFLCADDVEFSSIVERLYHETFEHRENGIALTSAVPLSLQVQEAIQNYNRVGLFSPEVRNMYHYTAAQKS